MSRRAFSSSITRNESPSGSCCAISAGPASFVSLRAQRVKLKLRRSDMIIAQGKRGTSATLGKVHKKPFPSPREERARRGTKGEGFLNLTAPHLPPQIRL